MEVGDWTTRISTLAENFYRGLFYANAIFLLLLNIEEPTE